MYVWRWGLVESFFKQKYCPSSSVLLRKFNNNGLWGRLMDVCIVFTDMAREAGTAALKDAGILYQDVEAVVASYCYGEPTSGKVQVAAKFWMIFDSFLSLYMQVYITCFSQTSSIWTTKGQRFGIQWGVSLLLIAKGRAKFWYYRGVSLLLTPKRHSQLSILQNDVTVRIIVVY